MTEETSVLSDSKQKIRQASNPDRAAIDESPLRAELFGATQMAEHGRHLAATHKLRTKKNGGRNRDALLRRLTQNAQVIADTCTLLAGALREGRQLTPASECLLEQRHIIDEQIRTVRRQLSVQACRALPCLEGTGIPRAYQLAQELVAHGDGRVDPDSLSGFIEAYQAAAPLELGELWAIPNVLRLALIENLRRAAARIRDNRLQRDRANSWALKMAQTAETSPSDLVLVVADMARSGQPMSTGFVAELARRLQGQGPALAPALQWMSTRLAETGLTVEQQIAAEIASQAADQVSINNSLASLRMLGTIDWQEFVERRSAVDAILRRDPAGVYGTMDFATREQYRRRIGQLAAQSRHTQQEVAEKTLEMALEHRDLAHGGMDARTRHVGYYLLGKGAPLLEQALGVRVPAHLAFARLLRRTPLAWYLGAVGLFTVLFTAAGVSIAREDAMPTAVVVLLGVFVLIGASQLALALVNYVAARHVAPQALPRMDYSGGVPDSARTLVVVPAVVHNEDNAAALVEAMEVRYLANRDPNIRFCLLTDFADAPKQHMPEDAALLAHLRHRVDDLNARYRAEALFDAVNEDGEVEQVPQLVEPFLLLHRPREWNAGENVWMGHERKRGKLAALHAFLHASTQERARDGFAAVAGDGGGLAAVRYVITLDTHTQLPRDCARQFIGSIDHPLNRPQLDMRQRRVVDGYGILQPRIAAALPGEHASLYELLGAGEWAIEPALDPHAGAVAHVYQNLFAQSTFLGRGIYDVDAFETVLAQRLPDNQLLSHEMLEGCMLRAGFLDDGLLYECSPARYSDDASRRHRRMRGDWQLAGWLRPTVPARGGQRERNPLTALSRWKLFDNLRRSLVAPSLAAALILGWTLSPSPLFWTLAVLAVLLLPALIALVGEALDKPGEAPWRQHLRVLGGSIRTQLAHAACSAVFLAYEAWLSVDAVVTACWRLLVSRRRLLEWRPARLAHPSTDMFANWSAMAASPILAVLTGLAIWYVNPPALTVAAPLLALWFIAPAVAWLISVPLRRKEAGINAQQTGFLQAVARKTWHYFDSFATQENNYLAPDHLQEQPVEVLAQRTSPTGMGLSLLANLSAWDFGFITTGRVAQRVEEALRAMERMERYQGHFYAWYDTRTLDPLPPLYVSTEGSGNLAAHLLTLSTGLAALADEPIATPQTFEGIAITLRVLEEHAAGAPPDVHAAIAQMHAELAPARLGDPCSLPDVSAALARLKDQAEILAHAVAADAASPLSQWAAKLDEHCRAAHAELLELAPWMRSAQKSLVDSSLTRMPTLRELAALQLAVGTQSDLAPSERERVNALSQLVGQGSARAAARIKQLARLSARAHGLATMDFRFLYNKTTRLLSAGYHVRERRQDPACHELLAASARLSSFVAIAQGQLPHEHWFALGRQLCIAGGRRMLLSATGALHDYLMPLVVMPAYRNTLLDQTYAGVLKAQIDYARARKVPWGMSESGYHTVDAALNYQCRSFGVPGTGLARGMGDDLVVAPYASMLALMVVPSAACANLRRLADLGLMGQYGFYEAVDYTPARLPRGQEFAVIRSFMAPHQGMGLLAISHLLHDRPMQRRFEADPLLQATLLVLQERMPRDTAIELSAGATAPGQEGAMPMRVLNQTSTPHPEVHLLSNGRYHVMVTGAGGGYQRWEDKALTRWREDATRDNHGSFIYVRDLETGAFWSTAYQPTLVEPDKYEVAFSEGRAEFRRQDGAIDLHTEIVVSPEDDAELRRVRMTNLGATRRIMELTTYAEVAMPGAPALEQGALLCANGDESWLVHAATLHGADPGEPAEPSFATSRDAFLGRGGSTAAPQALCGSASLESALEAGADAAGEPIVAVRYRVSLAPGQSVTLDVVTGMAGTREGALALAAKYRDARMCERVFELAWTHSQVVLRQLGASEADAQLYASLAGSVIYPNAALRADPAILTRNRKNITSLRAYGISGRRPLVLLQMRDPAHIELARQVVQAHAYWRMKGVAVDLVIWYEDQPGRRQALREQIDSLVDAHAGAQAGSVFVRLLDQIPEDDRVLMQSVARVFLSDARGSLADQIYPTGPVVPKIPQLVPVRQPSVAGSESALPARRLILSNGIGAFTPDGLEYVIRLDARTRAPAPWNNLLANSHLGCVVSETGQSHSWSANAGAFQLAAGNGEAVYIRNDETGRIWSPAVFPAAPGGEYVARHGFGYSAFEHADDGVFAELTVFVARDAAVKYSLLTLRNDSAAVRTLSVTGYVEWVLGEERSQTAMHVITELDAESGALVARNACGSEAGTRVAFFHADGGPKSAVTATGDRAEFIGRNGTLVAPAALARTRLSNRVGAGLDPCGAVQVTVELQPGDMREVVFVLGVGKRRSADTSAMVNAAKGAAAARAALQQVRQYWAWTLGALQVETPDPSVDVLVNGWLQYPALRQQGQGVAAMLEEAGAAARAGDTARAWELQRMLNPARRALGPKDLAQYKGAPYLAEDGAGLYRLLVDTLLGLQVEGSRLTLAPCLPSEWPGYRARYRHGETLYDISVAWGTGWELLVDGARVSGTAIEMEEGGGAHTVDLTVPR